MAAEGQVPGQRHRNVAGKVEGVVRTAEEVRRVEHRDTGLDHVEVVVRTQLALEIIVVQVAVRSGIEVVDTADIEGEPVPARLPAAVDRKSTRLNSSH